MSVGCAAVATYETAKSLEEDYQLSTKYLFHPCPTSLPPSLPPSLPASVTYPPFFLTLLPLAPPPTLSSSLPARLALFFFPRTRA